MSHQWFDRLATVPLSSQLSTIKVRKVFTSALYFVFYYVVTPLFKFWYWISFGLWLSLYWNYFILPLAFFIQAILRPLLRYSAMMPLTSREYQINSAASEKATEREEDERVIVKRISHEDTGQLGEEDDDDELFWLEFEPSSSHEIFQTSGKMPSTSTSHQIVEEIFPDFEEDIELNEEEREMDEENLKRLLQMLNEIQIDRDIKGNELNELRMKLSTLRSSLSSQQQAIQRRNHKIQQLERRLMESKKKGDLIEKYMKDTSQKLRANERKLGEALKEIHEHINQEKSWRKQFISEERKKSENTSGEQYKKIQDSDIRDFLTEKEMLNLTIHDLQYELTLLTEENKTLRHQLEKSHQDADKWKSILSFSVRDLSKEMDMSPLLTDNVTLKDSLDHLVKVIKNQRGRNASLKSDVEDLQKQIISLHHEITSKSNQIDKMNGENKQLLKKLSDLKQERNSLKNKLDTLILDTETLRSDASNKKFLLKQIDTLKKERVQWDKERISLKETIASHENTIKSLSSGIEEEQNSLSKNDSLIRELQYDNDEKVLTIKELTDRYNNVMGDLEKALKENNELREKYEKLGKTRKAPKEDLTVELKDVNNKVNVDLKASKG